MGLSHQPNCDSKSRYDYRTCNFPIRPDDYTWISRPYLELFGPHTADEDCWNHAASGNFSHLYPLDDNGSRTNPAIEVQEDSQQSGDVYKSDIVRFYLSGHPGRIRIILFRGNVARECPDYGINAVTHYRSGTLRQRLGRHRKNSCQGHNSGNAGGYYHYSLGRTNPGGRTRKGYHRFIR